jgi:hypothetical protein
MVVVSLRVADVRPAGQLPAGKAEIFFQYALFYTKLQEFFIATRQFEIRGWEATSRYRGLGDAPPSETTSSSMCKTAYVRMLRAVSRLPALVLARYGLWVVVIFD